MGRLVIDSTAVKSAIAVVPTTTNLALVSRFVDFSASPAAAVFVFKSNDILDYRFKTDR
jgi:hypothetical protein